MVRVPGAFDEKWIDLQFLPLHHLRVNLPGQAPAYLGFGRNVDENHALLLNETVAVGDRQDAPVLELFENRSEPALLRRADEKNLAALDLLDFLVKLDRELPAFDRPA